MIDKCILAFNKGRLLDVGDRYLNAKMSKIYIREGDIEKSTEIMKEFVGEPLTEENIKFSETLWYLNECGCSYLTKKNILKSHYCFKNVVDVFLGIIKDQVDFYNFCLRRYMLKDLSMDSLTREKLDKYYDNVLTKEQIINVVHNVTKIFDEKILSVLGPIDKKDMPHYGKYFDSFFPTKTNN